MGKKKEESWRGKKGPKMNFFFTHFWNRQNFYLLLPEEVWSEVLKLDLESNWSVQFTWG